MFITENLEIKRTFQYLKVTLKILVYFSSGLFFFFFLTDDIYTHLRLGGVKMHFDEFRFTI